MSLQAHQRAVCAYRNCYTSVLPLDDDLQEYPRSDHDYLFWLTSPHMLIAASELSVRPLTVDEMQSLADASYGLHVLYTKYSLMKNPIPPSSESQAAPSRPAFNVRSANPSDCALISSRLLQCRMYDELIDWYRWHGYAYSTTYFILQRAQYNGIMPIVLLRLYMKLEILLSACLCAFPSARQLILAQHHKGSSRQYNLPTKIYALLREGNPMNVPVSEASSVSDRSITRHTDMPSFFHELPFHYVNSSPLVEAWFAAPTAAERRGLIAWPSHADVAMTIRCPAWKLFTFEELPSAIYKRTGSSSDRNPRAPLHPQI